MRIALLSLEKGGGLTQCALEYATALSRVADVTCFLAENDALTEFTQLPCRTQVFQLERGARSLFVSMVTGRHLSAIAGAIVREAPDIVLDVGSGAWSGPVLRALKGRIPLAQVIHDADPHPDLRSFVSAVPSRLVSPVPDVFVALSAFSRRRLLAKHPRVPCVLSRLGVLMRSNWPDPARVAARRHRQLFFGRITPYKGLDVLASAVELARQAAPEIELSVVGPGHMRDALIRRLRAAGATVDNRYVPDAEISSILSRHGVMLLPYTSATQSGVAAMALGHGMPCIGTGVGGLPEQVLDARTGLIVPPRDAHAFADAMVRLATDAEYTLSMAHESVRIASALGSWTAICGDLVAALAPFAR